MRTFIAIDLSEDMISILDKIASRLKYAGADAKWISPENTHLTIKFLGEIRDDALPQICSGLDRIAEKLAPFNISTCGIGAFPTIDHPRVLWVGLGQGSDGLKAIASDLDSELASLGFEKESREFAAHITIGRLRSMKNIHALKEKILSTDQKSTLSNPHAVTSIALYKSALSPEGSIYTALHRADFKG